MRLLLSFLLIAALVAVYELVLLPGVFRLFGGKVWPLRSNAPRPTLDRSTGASPLDQTGVSDSRPGAEQ